MADLVELLGAGRRAAPGGLAAILDSGGERAHLVDAAADLGVPLARPSEETLRGVAARLEPGLPAVNPLDAWGTDNDAYTHLSGLLPVSRRRPRHRGVRLRGGPAQRARPSGATPGSRSGSGPRRRSRSRWSAASRARSRRAPQPACAPAGIPVLEDVASGLRAFRHLFERRDARALPSPTTPGSGAARHVRRRWREALAAGEHLGEADALRDARGLRDTGGPDRLRRPTSTGSSAAAGRIGYPVALKTAAASHKTERWRGDARYRGRRRPGARLQGDVLAPRPRRRRCRRWWNRAWRWRSGSYMTPSSARW